MQACVPSYDCAESGGVVWVKSRGTPQDPPVLEKDGWDFAGAVFNRLRAPLQLVIDNFSEIEHTVTAHPHFGFDAACSRQRRDRHGRGRRTPSPSAVMARRKRRRSTRV